MKKDFFAALRFITILPFGDPEYFKPERMLQYFPVVGLLLGFIIAFCDLIFCSLWSTQTASIIDIVLLISITGAFHLDGLGDAADGMLGVRSREKALSIMKDSRIGMMGLAAVACVLALKFAGLSELNENRFLFLLIIPAYSRGGSLFGFIYLKYLRSDEGTAKPLFGDKPDHSILIWMVIPAVLSLLGGFRGILLNIIFALTIYAILSWYKKRMGGITGDMLGAMTEITEAVLLLTVTAGL
ncbi:MAG: adenosylcobinamide-GDP ribazoletransferase [Desulfobacterales bacterium]|nr:adenosylcobinamide-GDP ribazoletransferase [Desulfobacterales bacterium]